MKQCFKCKTEKPIGEFYKHPYMADGHLGKCKDCTKKDAKMWQQQNRDRRAEYDKQPHRRARRVEIQREMRRRSPEKYKARCVVGNAVRDGRLIKQPCEVCGDPKSQAHHDDYSRPLDVRWMCFKHHRSIAHGHCVGP